MHFVAWVLLVLAATALSGCSRSRPCDDGPCRPPAAVGGGRAVVDPHGRWGARFNLQEPFVVEALNAFFAEEGAAAGFPPDIRVSAHANGFSLLYEWTDASGVKIYMPQTARPSLWFVLISANGRAFIAQERDWGFVATGVFGREPVENRAIIILHEFWHQSRQIHEQSAPCYWLSYAGQLACVGYGRMPGECEAYAVATRFEKFIERKYDLVFTPNQPHLRCDAGKPPE